MSFQFVKAERAVTAGKTFTLAIVLAFVFCAGAACRRSGVESNANTANGNSTAATDNTSKTPPFSTKEPERYQATMIVSGSLGGQSPAIPGVSNLLSKEVRIARDGDRRRYDYELIPGAKMTNLQLPSGNYVLLHSKKLYAEVKPGAAGDLTAAARNLPSDFSPDKLINETNPGANYEKLGTEVVNGRTTTKYKVTTTGKGEGRGLSTETIVWIDESLGMPVKSETTSTGEQARGSRVTMELREITQEVDQSIFELPKDYKKVSSEEITSQMLPSLGGLLGGDGEENARSKRK